MKKLRIKIETRDQFERLCFHLNWWQEYDMYHLDWWSVTQERCEITTEDAYHIVKELKEDGFTVFEKGLLFWKEV